MKKNFFIIIFLFISASLSAETRTLSSYNISPFGVFDKMQLSPQTSSIGCGAPNEGLLYYNATNDKMIICGALGERNAMVWKQAGSFIHPADTANDLYVGIGDNSPESFLEINASGLVHDFLLLSSDDAADGDVFNVRNNGNVGINSLLPDFNLTIDKDKDASSTADGGIISYGTFNYGQTYTLSDSTLQKPTFLWYPRIASFYAREMDAAAINFNPYTYAFGFDTAAEGYGSFATGKLTSAAFVSSFSSGEGTTAGHNYTLATGQNTTASGEYAVAMGVSTVASGLTSVAIGNLSIASGEASMSFGDTNTASGDYSVSMGSSNQSTAIAAVSMGTSSIASGNYSVAIGNANQSSGQASAAFGSGTTASGDNSFAVGNQTEAKGNNSFAVGNETMTYSFSAAAFGRFNIYNFAETAGAWVAGDPLFVVGNGASDVARSNAFTLLKNGNVAIGGHDPQGYRLRVYGGNAAVDAGSSWTTPSDIRLKKSIVSLGPTLGKVMNLRGVKYHGLKEAQNAQMNIGLIAQEAEREFPQIVVTNKEKDGFKGIDYGRITPILLEAIKELNSENTDLENLYNVLKLKMDTLKKRKAENSSESNL